MAGDPSPGYATLIEHFKTLSLETGRLEADNHPVPPMITKGWALLEKLTAPEVALVLRALLSDFTPLVRALERYPQTVVHGDWKLGNLGIMPAHARTILLDWAMIGRAPAALELGWYLAVNSARLPVTKEEAIDSYRQGLARRLGSRFSDSWWHPQLELSLLGSFLKLGWTKLLGTEEGETLDIRSRERVELEWWSQRALAGSKYL